MNLYHGLPVIDLSTLNATKNESELKTLSQLIYKVYSEVGFAYLVNHDISNELINAVFAQSRLFHHLPEIEKLKILQNQFFRGYMPMSTSSFQISSLGKATKPNQSAALILMHEVSENDPDFIKGINLAGPNQWPSEHILPHFKNTLMQYQKQIALLAHQCARLFSLALTNNLQTFDHYFKNPTWFLRLQYYPEQPVIIPGEQYGIAPHTDYGFLTLLVQDDLGACRF